MAGTAYWILAQVLIAGEGADSWLARALGKDRKGSASVIVYAIAISVAVLQEWLAQLLYLVVALLWLVPDRHIETHLQAGDFRP